MNGRLAIGLVKIDPHPRFPGVIWIASPATRTLKWPLRPGACHGF